MGARSSARESAFQMLFALDTSGQEVSQVIGLYWTQTPGDAAGKKFADTIVTGVAQHLSTIDDRIRASSDHWRLERMSRVDRNILRLGVWEVLYGNDNIPHAVTIDECVELAKLYGTEDSSSFVNGVLNKVAQTFAQENGLNSTSPTSPMCPLETSDEHPKLDIECERTKTHSTTG